MMPKVFDALPRMGSVSALHDVKLETLREADGSTIMVVARYGERAELPACSGWAKWLVSDVGKVGALVPAPTVDGSWTFRAYFDQSLRRAPELDGPDMEESPGRRPNVIGWRCEARLLGFRAPAGLVPGSHGAFVPDATEEVRVRVPQEFVSLCKQYGLAPNEMLNAFMADACDLSSTNALPRADGFQRSGSDEATMARAWVDRAFEHRRVEGSDDARDSAHGERVEEFEDLLLEFQSLGGDPEGLLDLVRNQLDARRQDVDPQ